MTPKEQKNYVANFQKRRTSRITHLASGYEEQFGDIPQPDKDTIRRKDVVPEGHVARQGVDQAWQSNVDDAITAIKRAIDNLGEDRSVGDVGAGLNTLLATCQALRKLPGNAVIEKAKVNRSDDGTTRPAMVYPANAESSKAGPRRTVTAAQLALLSESSKALFKKWETLGLVEIKL
jgi:hypothetical protein